MGFTKYRLYMLIWSSVVGSVVKHDTSGRSSFPSASDVRRSKDYPPLSSGKLKVSRTWRLALSFLTTYCREGDKPMFSIYSSPSL